MKRYIPRYKFNYIPDNSKNQDNLSRRALVRAVVKILLENHKQKVAGSTLLKLTSGRLSTPIILENRELKNLPIFMENGHLKELPMDKQKLYFHSITVVGDECNISNLWDTDSINNFIDNVHESFSDIVKISNDKENSEKIIKAISNIPLNQIFYGPPGTGKTHNVVNESLKIVGETPPIDEPVLKFDVFYRNNPRFLEENEFKPGKKPYRNLYAIPAVMKFFISENKDTLSKQKIIELSGWTGPSSYIQRARGLTNFELTEGDAQQSEELTLNTNGKKIKELFHQQYPDGNIPTESLPDFVCEHIFRSLKSTTEEKMTLWKNIILCALRQGITEGYLFKVNGIGDIPVTDHYYKISSSQAEILLKYYNYSGDLTFLDWVIAYLNNLKLLDEIDSSGDIKKFKLNEKAIKLVHDLEITAKSQISQRQKEVLYFNLLISEKKIAFITFHQSFSYEEFIEGIRPRIIETEENRKEISYEIEGGIFKEIVQFATNTPDENFVLIVDEINRGNISKILGELITLIEPSRRIGEDEELKIKLAYSGSSMLPNNLFGVPPNLYIIGTMNTADRSIALIDTALRRRFSFKEYRPDANHELISNDVDGIDVRQLLRKINHRIEMLKDRDHLIGHTYFLNIQALDELCLVFKDNILPLLQEYFYDEWEKIQLVLGDNDKWGKNEEEKIVQIKKAGFDHSSLFGITEGLEEYQDKIIYKINKKLISGEISKEAFIKIYKKPI